MSKNSNANTNQAPDEMGTICWNIVPPINIKLATFKMSSYAQNSVQSKSTMNTEGHSGTVWSTAHSVKGEHKYLGLTNKPHNRAVRLIFLGGPVQFVTTRTTYPSRLCFIDNRLQACLLLYWCFYIGLTAPLLLPATHLLSHPRQYRVTAWTLHCVQSH